MRLDPKLSQAERSAALDRDPCATPPIPSRKDVAVACEILLRAGFQIEAISVLQVILDAPGLKAACARIYAMPIRRLGDLQ